MGCVCCSLSSFISIVLDALERISLCTVCAMLTCCLLFTILTVLVLGIGIGFHYCYVQSSVEAMAKAAKAAGAGRSGPERMGPVMRSVDKAIRRGGFPLNDPARQRREADSPPLFNNITLQNLTVYNASEFLNQTVNRDNLTKIVQSTMP